VSRRRRVWLGKKGYATSTIRYALKGVPEIAVDDSGAVNVEGMTEKHVYGKPPMEWMSVADAAREFNLKEDVIRQLGRRGMIGFLNGLDFVRRPSLIKLIGEVRRSEPSARK
jgi:hypothetical protein